MLDIKEKAPADRLDYPLDFSKWITDDDTILSVESSIDLTETGGLNVDSALVESPVVTVWLSGGINTHSYVVSVTIQTQAGRIKEEKFKIRVRD